MSGTANGPSDRLERVISLDSCATIQLFSAQVYDAIVKYLGPHGPDGLLAFVIFAGAISAILSGLDPYLISGFGVIIYWIYSRRRGSAEKHAERMAEIEISKTELELQRYREEQLMKIGRDKIKTAVALGQARKSEGTK
jgi:hypothetical protein